MEHDCCANHSGSANKSHKEDVKKIDSKYSTQKGNSKNIMMYVMIGVVSLLLIFSIVEAVQLGNVKEVVSGGAVVSASPQASSSRSSSPSASAPQRSAPTMVGGC